MDIYATHTPALLRISQLNSIQIKTVTEFGLGAYSTKLFLDKTKFKHVTRLVTFESDSAYFHDFEQPDDPRLMIQLCPEDVAIMQLCHMPELQQNDLIFVDGKEARYRIPTAEAAISRARIVVVHDMDNPIYKGLLVKQFSKFKVLFSATCPHTCVFTQDFNIFNELIDDGAIAEIRSY